MDFLGYVAEIFGWNPAEFERLALIYRQDLEDDPFVILGVERDASWSDIKKAHRSLVREHHPDQLASLGLPDELMALADKQLARINAAFSRLKELYTTPALVED